MARKKSESATNEKIELHLGPRKYFAERDTDTDDDDINDIVDEINNKEGDNDDKGKVVEKAAPKPLPKPLAVKSGALEALVRATETPEEQKRLEQEVETYTYPWNPEAGNGCPK